MDTTMVNLWTLFEQLVRRMEIINEGNESIEFIQVVKDFEDFRKKYQRTNQELEKFKDLLLKAETGRSALDVKLKHARNQVDVEIKRRQRAEAECTKLEQQIQLIRDILMCDTSGSIQLSEEQKSALAFLNRGQASSGHAGNNRLSTIDESGSILSDISFDKTDESLDWDSSLVKNFKMKKREKRRSNSRQFIDGPPGPVKKTCSIGSTVDQANESIVAKTTVTVPSDGGPIEAVSTIETLPSWPRSRGKSGPLQAVNSDSALNSRPLEPRTDTDNLGTPQNTGGMRLHDFVSKTVIKPESCVPCGKRIKFGKLSLKCRDCRLVSHPECRDRCPLPCIPPLVGTPVKIGEGMLADFVSQTSPMIPAIVVSCVNEIEQRGLTEAGLYRISGCDRTVKELKEKFLKVKTVPLLSKVDDIHVICSLLKDFLRNLKEPLLTFWLSKAFMEAAEITDEDNSTAAMYQAISELPQANRDTLAFLMIHLQRVSQSPDTKMDIANLAKIFGPTIVAHTVPNPDPVTMFQDIKRQLKVVERLLSLPLEYWNQFMMVDQENIDCQRGNGNSTPRTPDVKVSLLGPVTTPEFQLVKTPLSSSLSQRLYNLSKSTPRFGNKSKSATNLGQQGKFFPAPYLK
ncbi:rac GTPase-activating protein 1 isoform X1 [Mus pahari]|uniref:rac GTPase-activating protein 1 isoform X1 n=1 Tax=Mus pahari TaxID=10093 RepID=UPI000A30625E|nr:rac GTPase-activating protein 1 isoform X1 [Mus pahari]XP_021073010.1 rac GTPase-activating protein 1 isoform X1 [Mus pahari]